MCYVLALSYGQLWCTFITFLFLLGTTQLLSSIKGHGLNESVRVRLYVKHLLLHQIKQMHTTHDDISNAQTTSSRCIHIEMMIMISLVHNIAIYYQLN
jgi:hypothetical protein